MYMFINKSILHGYGSVVIAKNIYVREIHCQN